jgi:rare lipoprotein A
VNIGLVLSAVFCLALTGCFNQAEVPHPHYVLGAPYQASGAWHYPRENYELDETGLAQAIAAGHPALTTDGEAFDQTAMAAAHPTLQLPAIARVTNLETGRAVLVRINDRGSGTLHRAIELTRRASALLGMAENGVARVRVQVLPVQSHDAADALPDAPHLAVAAAPRGSVEVAELPPPPGARSGQGYALTRAPAAGAEPAETAMPLRLPETVTQGRASPGRLWVRLDSFEEYEYAAVQRARAAGLGAHITQVNEGRTQQFRVEAGPLDDVRQADAILDQALAAGIPDARIVVE